MSKDRDFSKFGANYKKSFAKTFYDFCCQGYCLAQIAHAMQVEEQVLVKWSDDPKKKEFGRAYRAGKTACEAFHAELLDQMIKGKATQVALQTQLKRLQTLFPDTWNIASKTDVVVEDKTKSLSDDQLLGRIEYLKKKLKLEDTKPDLKVIEGGNGSKDK